MRCWGTQHENVLITNSLHVSHAPFLCVQKYAPVVRGQSEREWGGGAWQGDGVGNRAGGGAGGL